MDIRESDIIDLTDSDEETEDEETKDERFDDAREFLDPHPHRPIQVPQASPFPAREAARREIMDARQNMYRLRQQPQGPAQVRPQHPAPAVPVIDLEGYGGFAVMQQPSDTESQSTESKDLCFQNVLVLFPDICLDYLTELFDKGYETSENLIAHICNKLDDGATYPKAKDKQKSLKRKRALSEDEEITRKYGSVDRIIPDGLNSVRPFIASLLSQEFPRTPMDFIRATLAGSGHRLFSAYRVLEEAQRTYETLNLKPYSRNITSRKLEPYLREGNLETYIENPRSDIQKIEVLKEFQASRRLKKKGDANRQAEREKELEEEANVRRAEAEGTMGECGCCYADFPMNRMVHCNGVELHWFCRGCARMSAEVEIGKSKYHLQCMSTGKCDAGFSMDQRGKFLDDKTTVALERNEQEANLRLAGIENLASCPFCPFAMEYPPVEIDKEFRCQAEDCEKVSCRLCKLESHIPKSCEEFAKENGLSIRRQIEEAMSAALIRTCNKCTTPFVKEEGCNKMTCTRNGCYNIQCYVCSKSCSYDHFNDSSRGGKPGNCPLFESVEERHEDEVKKAEKNAMDKVLADHPEFTEEDLKVKMSENVKKDDEKRKAKDPRAAGHPGMAAMMQRMNALAAERAAGMGMGNVILGRFDNGAIFGALPPPPPPVQIGRRNAAHSILWERAHVAPQPLPNAFLPVPPLVDDFDDAQAFINHRRAARALPFLEGAGALRQEVVIAPGRVVFGDAPADDHLQMDAAVAARARLAAMVAGVRGEVAPAVNGGRPANPNDQHQEALRVFMNQRRAARVAAEERDQRGNRAEVDPGGRRRGRGRGGFANGQGGRPRAGAVAVAEIQMQMPLDNERRAVIIGANVNAPMVIRRHAPVVNRRRAPRQAPDRNLERQVAPVRDNARERQALGLPVMYAGRVVAVNAAAVNGAANGAAANGVGANGAAGNQHRHILLFDDDDAHFRAMNMGNLDGFYRFMDDGEDINGLAEFDLD